MKTTTLVKEHLNNSLDKALIFSKFAREDILGRFYLSDLQMVQMCLDNALAAIDYLTKELVK